MQINNNRRTTSAANGGSAVRRNEHDNSGDSRRVIDIGNSSSSKRVDTEAANNEDPDVVVDQLLVQAEKFKARIEAPKGNNFSHHNYAEMLMSYDYDKLRNKFVRPEGLGPIDSEILFLRNFDQDDKFFHVTSQIEPVLHLKIERGEFIELECLLPKDRFGSRSGNDDLNKQLFQLISQGTSNYLEPPIARTGKINSVRKWDQAFRVYAAIYTNANPQRSSEIWQYVYVIHTAAASNPWDNVYLYDVNFRQLMATKPWRSWGKTYTQGWNMAFNNSISNSMASHNSNSSAASSSSIGSSHSNKVKAWKDDCCWRYNKNRCKRTASECNYDHRCTYCAGWYHRFFNCRKRLGSFKNKKLSSNGSNHGKHNSSPKKEKKQD